MRQLVTMFAAVLLLATAPLHAQHLGARLQWQPEIADLDSRLQQKVEIEILGRAAVPALELLSNATGVSLTVAPEDLDTVGERKLTIISKGLTLKAIMVQLPEALQECHWDIDSSGDEPFYLLHRNAGVEVSVREERQRRVDAWVEKRSERLDFVRQALTLSEEGLRELEKTDPLLALALQDPFWRINIEAFFALPPDFLRKFIEGPPGRMSLRYGDAPEQVQRSVDRILERYKRPKSDRLQDVELAYERMHKDGPVLLIICGKEYVPQVIIPTRGRFSCSPSWHAYELLVGIGGRTEQELAELSADRTREAMEAWKRERDMRRPPAESPLHRPYTIPSSDHMPFTDFLEAVSQLTELSIVSDAFPNDSFPVAADMRGEMPVWRLLERLSRQGIEWITVGDCLVFHHTDWYHLSQEQSKPERNDATIPRPNPQREPTQ